MEPKYPIIVGYDGSVEAVPAVQWAARQAVLRGCSLHLVHSTLWPAITHDLGPVPGVADSGLRRAAEKVVTDGVAWAHKEAPELNVTSSLMYGWPAEHLRELSANAGLLVVGSRGIGGFLGLLVGSVSLELAATAACPVVVVRSADHPDGPVVVGVDSQGWEPVLNQACTLASLTGVALRVVHVRKQRGLHLHADANGTAVHNPLEEVRSAAHSLAPGLEVEDKVVEGASIPGSLLSASRDASIVVVGTTGRGLIRGTVGSTAHAVLHHAKCPVMVVRH